MTEAEKAQKEFEQWMASFGDNYIGKEKKADWWNNRNTNFSNNKRIEGLGGNLSMSGSPNEIQGRLDGLERARMLTGKNPHEIGADYQDAFSNIQKRVNLSDTASELLRANKAGAVADARNEMQKAGVKGGSAANAVSQIERAKSYDVNNQLMQNQRQAENDYLNATKANANFATSNEMNFGAMAAGKDVKAPNSYSNGFGNFGTVICTELWKQGYYSNKVYMADIAYGVYVRSHKPEVYYGYRFLADPIVSLMQKSKTFTKLVALFAVPWAKNMAGEENFIGKAVSLFGEPLCAVVGKTIRWRLKYGY